MNFAIETNKIREEITCQKISASSIRIQPDKDQLQVSTVRSEAIEMENQLIFFFFLQT